MRTRVVWLASTAVTVPTVAILIAVPSPHEPVPRVRAPSVSTSATVRALAIYRTWERRRERAWARSDVSALQALYVRGSTSGRRDGARLVAYRARGLRVVGMRRQVIRARIRRCDGRVVDLVVTDRLVDPVVAGGGRRLALPDARPATRRVVLRRSTGGWRVVDVYRL
jgi:hypothetical protein